MKPLYQVRCTLWVLAESRAQALDLADDFLQQNAPDPERNLEPIGEADRDSAPVRVPGGAK